MALLTWIEDRTADEIIQLAEAIEAGDVPQDRVDRLRELIQDTDREIREEAIVETAAKTEAEDLFTSPFTQLEDALGLPATAPPVGEPGGEQVSESDVVIEEVVDDEARQEALDELERLLAPTPGRDFEYYDDLARALETGNAREAGLLTQDTLNSLTADDRAELAEVARERRDAQEDLTLSDFPGIKAAIRRSGGRDVAYFENVLRELRGEIPADRLPADALEDIQERFPDLVEEAVTRVEQHIEDLQAPDRRGAAQERGSADIRGPAPAERPDIGRDEPFQDEDYISGEPITRDPEFEEKFVELARDLGRARSLDLFPLPPDDYFQLTAENQQKFYDVTPREFLVRALRRGEVTRPQLRQKYGFDSEHIPDENEL